MSKSNLRVILASVLLFPLMKGFGSSDFVMIPTVQWTWAYRGPGFDAASSALQTTDGGLLLTGFQIDETGNEDMYLVKLHPAIDPNGKGDFFSSPDVIISLMIWILTFSFSFIIASWFLRRKSRLKEKRRLDIVKNGKLEP